MATRTLTPAAQIAANARADIKAARKAGTLVLPDGAKIRITSENFSLGSGVTIAVTDVDRDWALTTGHGALGDVVKPTAEAKVIGDALTAILHRHGAGRTWGDVTILGIRVDDQTIHPASYRAGQD
ncbi:hypothetical protein OOJ91_12525 [Micromonospora lupini]|uniref:hypothetical protein n=1 Tax=Micromonospora lupini TaxID=285679 RepID=UPI00225AD51C|nr:hypothetical protein [Micromonospora lupini]MCX5066705.1 hypothetical protein [Micromonospora lupini]